MKTRIVLWGSQEDGSKVLLGIELKAMDNNVLIHVFPEKEATEIFYNLLMNAWRDGRDVEFPENHQTITRPLTASEPILPELIRVQRTDVVQRAQAEWHFVVLSAKLKAAYDSEISDLKERVNSLTSYDGGVWEELKGFWGKVQGQIREKNLFRNHANAIKSEVNELFDELKKKRSEFDSELKSKSEEVYKEISDALDVIEEKIEKGLGLQPIFNDLKNLQRKFKDGDMVRKHQNKLWKRIDKAFKKVKERRFGEGSGSQDRLSRIRNRYEGLVKAINRMKSSIGKDKKDIEFEERRINTTDGQLEAQIRQAKLVMIQDRISSKQTKLDDMLKVEENLKKQIEKEEERIEKAKLMAAAKEEAKEKIAQEVSSAKEKMEEIGDKLETAVEKVKSAKATKPASSPEPRKSDLDKVVDNISTLDQVLKS
jgi:chromosome segregation ATPase